MIILYNNIKEMNQLTTTKQLNPCSSKGTYYNELDIKIKKGCLIYG